MPMTKICRGKRVDNEKWVDGYYVCLNGKSHRIYTGYAETDCGEYYPIWYEVIPETVGLCTDLPDKNGKFIFEGDIFASPENPKVKKVVYWGEDTASFEWFCGDGLGFNNEEVEVLGNVHDNPEILVD